MLKELKEVTIKYNRLETTEIVKRDQLEERSDQLSLGSVWELLEHVTTIDGMDIIHYVLGQEELEDTTFLCVDDEGNLHNYYWNEIDEIGLAIEGCYYCGEKAYTESSLLVNTLVCEDHYLEEVEGGDNV